MPATTKIILPEDQAPTHWNNIAADMQALGTKLEPVLHPGTGQPVVLRLMVDAGRFPASVRDQRATTNSYGDLGAGPQKVPVRSDSLQPETATEIAQ